MPMPGSGSKTRRLAGGASLQQEIAHLPDLDLAGLRTRWKGVFRRPPPSHLPRHLLLGVLAYRLQADELGDLAPDTIRLLKQLGGGGTVEAVRLTSELSQRRTDLRVGTILIREWNGRPQRTMVMANGFAWNGKTFDSLSAVAFATTGTRWNGHRFFGLRDKIRSASISEDGS
jgi:hypothetical protein